MPYHYKNSDYLATFSNSTLKSFSFTFLNDVQDKSKGSPLKEKICYIHRKQLIWKISTLIKIELEIRRLGQPPAVYIY